MKVFLAEQNGQPHNGLLTSSRYRPFIGVSVSNRLLPLDATIKVLSWVLHTPAPVLPILIADEIAIINYKAFKHYSGGNCVKKVQGDAEKQVAHWQEAARHLPAEQHQRVRFVRWTEIVTPIYEQQTAAIRAEFDQGGLLQQAILSQVESFIRYTGKTVTTQRCLDLAEYVIQELPSLLFGIEVAGQQHQMLVYPTHYPTGMQRLIVLIRRSPAFSKFLATVRSQPLENNKIVQLIITGQRFEKPHPSLQPSVRHGQTADGQLVNS
ncbi:MAG: tRNA-dependent cyclodipeptide synthase [Methylovulum sp.]|nr:tRNA-dependent cyclodipeptide synthase [Methylovulum sp.]